MVSIFSILGDLENRRYAEMQAHYERTKNEWAAHEGRPIYNVGIDTGREEDRSSITVRDQYGRTHTLPITPDLRRAWFAGKEVYNAGK